MLAAGYIPASFGQSYAVPLPILTYSSHQKSLTMDDFEGVSISPVIFKVLEHCIGLLERFGDFFVSGCQKFGGAGGNAVAMRKS